ncbi:MAG: DUF1684 domain-containing protein [Flavobacteriales bacterium]|nr:DUF1684 domain-containing protein [Flavobacteriales bacterium]
MRAGLLFFLLALMGSAQAQTPDPVWVDSLDAYWGRMNAEYRDSTTTPLPPEARAYFTELERFAPDARFRVTATFKAKLGKEFQMRTTTDRMPTYQPVGTLEFRLAGKKLRLTVYRSPQLSAKPEYANYLFVPFTDLTNGEATYGGGRYLDLTGPLGSTVELDFNKAYNPYCAYGGKYSCPLPPAENHLRVAVTAGVKAFAH